MIYLEPFKGAKEVRKYFDKVTSIVPGDLKFCVEDITDGDPRKVGVKWCGVLSQWFCQAHASARVDLAQRCRASPLLGIPREAASPESEDDDAGMLN